VVRHIGGDLFDVVALKATVVGLRTTLVRGNVRRPACPCNAHVCIR
jgi:hypothetical protein